MQFFILYVTHNLFYRIIIMKILQIFTNWKYEIYLLESTIELKLLE